MNTYPHIAWEHGAAEVIACGPHRFRLVWQGHYVGKFNSAETAVEYAESEFLP